MRTKTINIPQDAHKALKQVALDRDTSISALIAETVPLVVADNRRNLTRHMQEAGGFDLELGHEHDVTMCLTAALAGKGRPAVTDTERLAEIRDRIAYDPHGLMKEEVWWLLAEAEAAQRARQLAEEWARPWEEDDEGNPTGGPNWQAPSTLLRQALDGAAPAQGEADAA